MTDAQVVPAGWVALALDRGTGSPGRCAVRLSAVESVREVRRGTVTLTLSSGTTLDVTAASAQSAGVWPWSA